MQCRDFRELADSYMSDELLVETNHEVLAHLEGCAKCRCELTARRELRATLRAAFAKAAELQIDDAFATRLRSELHSTALRQPALSWIPKRTWLPIAACFVAVAALVAIGLRYRDRTPPEQTVAIRETAEATGSPTVTQSNSTPGVAVMDLASFAVDDHRYCAIKFRLKEIPIPLEEAGQKFDRAYLELEKSVKDRLAVLAGGATFVEAHSCVLAGRRFAHVVLKENGHLVSFLITGLDDPESVGQNAVASKNDGQVISCSEAHGYRVSCFETARHAVFVVSDLSEGANLSLARALAPAIYQHLAKAENVAEIPGGDHEHA